MSSPEQIPVVFVNGLWLHHTSWNPWLELFAARGYAPVAPSWPGEGATVVQTRTHPQGMANRGIAEITDHVADVIAGLPATPVVIGHSFGGLIAQRLLAGGFARACVVMSPAQFRGILALPLPQLESSWPILHRPDLRKKNWAHTPESFHRFFANAVPENESEELFEKYAIPGPTRPVFQVALSNLTVHSDATVDTGRERGPLLLIAATADRIVPESTVRAAYRIQERNPGVTEFTTLQGRGHSHPIDHGWRDVADLALDFLTRNHVTATTLTDNP